MSTHVFHAMGTAVSVTAPALDPATLTAVEDAFERLEDRFSLYRPGTEGALVAARELLVLRSSPEFRSVYDRAVDWRATTDGAFTPHRPDGVIDLSGIVKAIAIDAAGEVLSRRGPDWCINAGGDVLVSGRRPDGRDWVVGIVDPADRTALLSQYTSHGGRCAVATSGTAERGEHVWRTGADATFCQVTVVADDIETADVLATAVLAAGPALLDRIGREFSVEVLAVEPGGRLWATPGFRAPRRGGPAADARVA